jgi:spoIIIJ-associated protein
VTEADAGVVEAEWPSVETSGMTVEEAIAAALAEFGVGADEVAVEVLSRPARVLPGERVSGAAEARVRVSRLDPHTARARATLAELLERMGIPARIATRRAATADGGPPAPPLLDISGDDLGLLIGWRGETLRALQTVVNLMMGDNEVGVGRRVILDVERYRARREEQVRELALRLANRVKRTGQRYTLDPMHAYERRTIHMTLAEDEGVRTESTGKEPARRVVIHATGPAQPDLPELPERMGRPPQRGGGPADAGRGRERRPGHWQRG